MRGTVRSSGAGVSGRVIHPCRIAVSSRGTRDAGRDGRCGHCRVVAASRTRCRDTCTLTIEARGARDWGGVAVHTGVSRRTRATGGYICRPHRCTERAVRACNGCGRACRTVEAGRARVAPLCRDARRFRPWVAITAQAHISCSADPRNDASRTELTLRALRAFAGGGQAALTAVRSVGTGQRPAGANWTKETLRTWCGYAGVSGAHRTSRARQACGGSCRRRERARGAAGSARTTNRTKRPGWTNISTLGCNERSARHSATRARVPRRTRSARDAIRRLCGDSTTQTVVARCTRARRCRGTIRAAVCAGGARCALRRASEPCLVTEGTQTA